MIIVVILIIIFKTQITIERQSDQVFVAKNEILKLGLLKKKSF